MTFARCLVLAALAVSLTACGKPAPLAGTALGAAGVQARGINVTDAIERAKLAMANGQPEEAKGLLDGLSRTLEVKTSKDLRDFAALAAAQRACVKAIAAKPGAGPAWFAPAHAEAFEVNRTHEKALKAVRTLVRGRLVDYDDVMVLVNEALESMLDPFPTIPAEVMAKLPKNEQVPADGYFPYQMYATSLANEAKRLAADDGDVVALQQAVAGMMDAAIKSTAIPRDYLARLAVFAAGFDNTKAHPAKPPAPKPAEPPKPVDPAPVPAPTK